MSGYVCSLRPHPLNLSSFVWSLSICVFPHVSYDIILYSGNICPVKPPHHRLSLRINQKFLKVPLNVMDFHRCPEESRRITKSFHNWWTGVLSGKIKLNFVSVFRIRMVFFSIFNLMAVRLVAWRERNLGN